MIFSQSSQFVSALSCHCDHNRKSSLMFVMLIVVTVLTKDSVYANPIDDVDLDIQLLFKQTFFQHLTNNAYHATRYEGVKNVIKNNTNVHKNVTTVTQKNETQKNVTQKIVSEHKRPLQTKAETRLTSDCVGKKCPDYEEEDADREDHITQLVDDMFVNTDSEITSLQVNEHEDVYFPSASDSQSGQDQL